METYTNPRALIENPGFKAQKKRALAGLGDQMIDSPLLELVNGFNRLPHCFTLQCCFGHFVLDGGGDPHNLDPLPKLAVTDKIQYRIAYICLCIDQSAPGAGLLEALRRVPRHDPAHIQFCCAEWFWNRQVNSYALQVQPDRYKREDSALLEYAEAVRVEQVRNAFFTRLREMVL